ncbi:MAG TPA: LysR family transcriptional regulator [Devosiaceae bacterium]
MKNFLDSKRLRYFKAIAEHGSLSGAARALNLAQPALSHHVTELETQLGVRILERRHDGVSLTEAGKVLLRHAIDITARVEKAEIELARFARDQGTKVKVRLAVISSLASDLTPVLFEVLSREMPEIVLRITESGTLDSRDLLDRGEADFAVYLTPEDAGGELPLARERLYFVTTGNSAVADPVSFAEVAEQNLVMPALGNPLRSFAENAAASTGHALNVVLEVDGSEPRRNAVLAGLGSTIVGAHSVHGAGRRVGIVARPIVEPVLFRPIFFGARRGLDPALVARIRSIMAKAFADFGGMEVDPALTDADA